MTVRSLNGLARTLWLRGGDAALVEAEQTQQRAIDLAKTIDGATSASVAMGTDMLGCIARDRGQLDRAIEFFRQSLAIWNKLRSPPPNNVAAEMLLLSDALTRAGKPDEAVSLAEQALATRTKLFPPGHSSIAAAQSIVGFAYAGAGQFDKAEPLMLESFKTLEAGSLLGRRLPRDAAGRLVFLYEKWGKPQQAQQWRQRRDILSGPTSRPS
jgi:tetratricopeptide (TPR) repeat protein